MSDTIRTILEELYALEPELKNQEAELAPMILKLVKAKPDVELSAEFVAALKLKLINQEQALMTNGIQTEDKITLLTKIASFMRTPYLLTGTAVIIFILILVSSLPGALRRSAAPSTFVSSITKVEPGAFGNLAATAGVAAENSIVTGASAKMAAPQAAPQAVAMDSAAGFVGLNESSVSSMTMPVPSGLGGGSGTTRPYYYSAYTYNYAGEPVTDLPAQVDVLRRVKNVGFPLSAGFFKSFDVGNFKLDSFTKTSLANVTLVEDKEFGYIITIDFNEGLVSVYENWRRWPNPYNDCKDEVCYRNLRLPISDLPADETVVSLANDWLILRNINPSDYGTPYVQNDWRQYYNVDSPKQSATYVPDVLTVIYPLKVNNTSVYENGGAPAGFGVNVNVRYQRVSGIWNFNSQRYQSSAYSAETDFETLIKYLNNGNQGYPTPLMYPMPPIEGDAKAVELQLGTPTVGYMKHWLYQNNESDELLLPALVFPILNSPDQSNYYSPKQVVVPLVKEYWQMINPVTDGPIRIMPASEPSNSGEGSSPAVGPIEPSMVDVPPTQ